MPCTDSIHQAYICCLFVRPDGAYASLRKCLGISPTSVRVTVTGIVIARIAGGKIVEDWANWDTLGMLQQLGVVPPLVQGGG